MLKEFLTFGASARLHAALANSARTEIAAHFGVTTLPVFDSWVRCFVDLRNICAHHDRLFNRRFQRQPRRLRRTAIPIASPPTLKAQPECLDHALTSANAVGNWSTVSRRFWTDIRKSGTRKPDTDMDSEFALHCGAGANIRLPPNCAAGLNGMPSCARTD